MDFKTSIEILILYGLHFKFLKTLTCLKATLIRSRVFFIYTACNKNHGILLHKKNFAIAWRRSLFILSSIHISIPCFTLTPSSYILLIVISVDSSLNLLVEFVQITGKHQTNSKPLQSHYLHDKHPHWSCWSFFFFPLFITFHALMSSFNFVFYVWILYYIITSTLQWP